MTRRFQKMQSYTFDDRCDNKEYVEKSSFGTLEKAV